MTRDRVYVPGGYTTLGIPRRYQRALAHTMEQAAPAIIDRSPERRSEYRTSEEYFLEFIKGMGARRIYVPAFFVDRSPVSKDALERKRQSLRESGVRTWCHTCGASPIRSSNGGSADDVSWAEATLYCALEGGRLPTIAEFLRMIRRDSDCPDLTLGPITEYGTNRDAGEESESWSGCLDTLTGVDEWTSTPSLANGDLVLWNKMADYLIVGKRPRDLWPLVGNKAGDPLSFNDGSSKLLRCRHGRSLPITYDHTGFRCVYPA